MIDETPAFDAGAKGDNARPTFRIEPIKNEFQSAQKGRPVYEDREFVHILVPGDRKTEWDGLVKEEHRLRWPREYAAFKAGMETPTSGIPLTEWAGIARAQVEELRFAHILTVEQLAELPDDALNRSVSMGGFALREKAKRWLDEVAGNAQSEALAAENALLRESMAAMKSQHEDLLKRVAEVEARSKAEATQ